MSQKIAKKILIIRLSSLGDILLTLPLLKIVYQIEEETVIDFLTKKEFIDAVKFNPYINEVISFSYEERKLVKEIIRNKKYDIIIDLQNNFRSHQLYSFNFHSRIFRFKKPTLRKFLLVNFKINLLKTNPSIAYHYIKTFYPNINENIELELYFPIPDDITERARNQLTYFNTSRKLIGICPGAKHLTKRYPLELMKELVQILIEREYSVAIFGGKEDREICELIKIDSPYVKNFQNDNELLLTAALMKNCSAVICNDSAYLHLASLLKIPTVAVFGSTVKEFGFFPIFKKSIIVENNSLSCRPCSHIGRNNCPKGHLKCLMEISPKLIAQKTEDLLKDV